MMGDCQRIEGVIFDLDGLMVDSETIAAEAWRLLLAPYEATLTEAQYENILGKSHGDSVRYILEQTEGRVPLEVLNCGFWPKLMDLIDECYEPMLGLLALLEELDQRGYLLGVASNSPIAYVRKALEKLGIATYFSCVFGADQVSHPKPAPHVYLEAARCLTLPPECCLAFEDSPTGVCAALAAGMRCVFIPNSGLTLTDLEGTYAVFPSLVACFEALDEILSDTHQGFS